MSRKIHKHHRCRNDFKKRDGERHPDVMIVYVESYSFHDIVMKKETSLERLNKLSKVI